MRTACVVAAIAWLVGVRPAVSRADSVMDGINVGANTQAGWIWFVQDVGWFYTPGFSYYLTGIDSRFDTSDGRTCTLEFFLFGPPSDGGTLLASQTFTPAATPTWSGVTFSTAVPLTAGTTYFVGFRNVSNLGVNITNDPGATALSVVRADWDGSGSYQLSASSGSIRQPILRYRGEPLSPVPEAGTLTALLGLLSGGGLWLVRRKR